MQMIKITLATLIILLPKTVFAGQEIDETLKSQCKYILYGNLQGSHNDQAEGYLLGFVQGLEYMTAKEELTEFFTSRNYRMIIERACQNALKHPTKKGFQKDYKFEAFKLISTKGEVL